MSAAVKNVTFHSASEREQQDNVQNGTLQGIGDTLAMTIETHIEIPAAVAAQGRQAIEAELTRIVAKCNEATFTITIGISADAEADEAQP